MTRQLSAVETVLTELRGEPEKLLIVIAGPSGVGKNTIIKEILASYPDVMQRIRTYTTRHMRPGEIEGEQYYFVSHEEFTRLAQAGKLLETSHQVYRDGIFYSMPTDLFQGLDPAKHIVVAEIDIHGARLVRKLYPDCVTIFLTAPPHVLVERIRHRRDEEMDDENLQNRLNLAREHITASKEFDYLVYNEENKLHEAVNKVKSIIDSIRMKIPDDFRLEDTIPEDDYRL